VSRRPHARRLVAHLREPLNRTGYALTASSLAGAAFGLAFWVAAARLYDALVVGRTAAAISVVMLLSTVAMLFLDGTLVRFLPLSGVASARFVVTVYCITAATAVVVASAVLVLANTVVTSLGFLVDSVPVALGFVAATAIWALFTEQDSALTGLRRATWVPIENVSYSLARLGLLAALVAISPTYGIFLACMLPALALLAAVSVVLFRWLIPRHAAATRAVAVPLRVRELAAYAGTNYAATLIAALYALLPPIIVLHERGSVANAHFYVPWVLASSLALVGLSSGVGLTLEASITPSELNAYRVRATRNVLRLVLPAALFFLIFAEPFLRIFGEPYADDGATLLRLLALACVPQVVVSLTVAALRAERRLRPILTTQTGIAVVVLGLGYALTAQFGIWGMGAAYLAAQTGAALLLSRSSVLRRPGADALGVGR
jgi:O-antigen/teichoic acid export membrane protein